MDAFIAAGGIPMPGDPLYPFAQGKPKALLELAGKPMIQWVLDALEGARLVDRIVIVGLAEDARLHCGKPLSFYPGRSGFFENVMAGRHIIRESNPEAAFALAVSSDIPAVTPEAIDWLISETMNAAHEVYFVVVRKEVMEAAFPGARRSYVHLKSLNLCSADMHVLGISREPDSEDVWMRLADARKHVFRMASLFGVGFLARVALRRVSLEKAERHICGRLGVNGRVLLSPYAEIGMDVDKPHQLEMLRIHLEKRKVQNVPPGPAQ
ncbi:MAG: NTP transferase domain-containing protein [Candidatus Aminicenantes bacterium]|nr:NTP transferase domain-containing protein [Candidatus Aminicenantes bacterium]